MKNLVSWKLLLIFYMISLTTINAQNIAIGKATTQSSIYGGQNSERAVDGNLSGDVHTHTQQDQSPYWRVDLESIYNITSIKIYNRSSASQSVLNRLVGFKLYVGNINSTNPNDYTEIATLTGGLEQEFNSLNISARYVMVYGENLNEFLSLAEVEVYKSVSGNNAQNLHSDSNAASINSESNSSSGWGGSAAISYVSSEFYSGSYSLKLEASSNGWQYRGYGYTTIPNEQYLVKVYAKSASTSTPRIYLTGAIQNQTMDITSTNWVEYSGIVEASGNTMNVNVYTGTPSIAGDIVYIDHVSITQVNSGGDFQAPTTPTNITVANITSDSANISWSASSDNGGGFVNGYKIYNNGNEIAEVTGTSTSLTSLSEQTDYNISIAAYDNASPINTSAASSPEIQFTTQSSGGNNEGGSGNSVWSESNSVASYDGKIQVGNINIPSEYRMAIDGKLITEEVRVKLSGSWPDYVFDEDYKLSSLDEIQKHIKEKGHLPNIPSAKEVETNGIELGEMNKLLLEKIEELTLYTIEQQREIEKLKELIKNK